MKLTIKQIKALRPCSDQHVNDLKAIFPKKHEFSVSDAFAAGISQRNILWVLYSLKDEDVNTKLSEWLDVIVKRAADRASCVASFYAVVDIAANTADNARAIAIARATAADAAEDAVATAADAATASAEATSYAESAAYTYADYASYTARVDAACAADAEREAQEAALIELFK